MKISASYGFYSKPYIIRQQVFSCRINLALIPTMLDLDFTYLEVWFVEAMLHINFDSWHHQQG